MISGNIFIIMNILNTNISIDTLSKVFQLLGQPSRLKIILTIGKGEACVCHIKDALNKRQAYISQQLMLLKDTNMVSHRRVGRNLYYRLTDQNLLMLIEDAAKYLKIPLPEISIPDIPGCPYYACIQEAKKTIK